MDRLGRTATVGLAMLLPLTAGSVAHAKGSVLQPERKYYAVGMNVRARAPFGPGQFEGRVRDGPYYAYLVPRDRWIHKPGPIPEYAIPLGEISISRRVPDVPILLIGVARLEFTVPQVRPGLYSIDYCNRPCTVRGIGDLQGGSFWVSDTVAEARFVAQIERRYRETVERLRARAARGARSKVVLQTALAATRLSGRDLARQVDHLQGRLAELDRAEDREPGDALPIVWLLTTAALSLALLVVLTVVALRARRSRRRDLTGA